MSAGLLEYDWMMSVKQRPWHGIGTVVEVKFNRLQTNRNILADTKAMENKTVPINTEV